MENKEKEFLPLGSVVIVKGTVKKLMITARAVFVDVKGEATYFDYGACTYPEGVLSDNMFYFQNKDIAEVVAKGYADEDDIRMQVNIRAGLEKMEKQEEK